MATGLIKRSALESTRGHAQVVVALILPVDEEQHKLLQTEGLHVAVVNHVEAKVKQTLVFAGIRLEHRADIEL